MSTTAQNPGSYVIISNHKPQSESSLQLDSLVQGAAQLNRIHKGVDGNCKNSNSDTECGTYNHSLINKTLASKNVGGAEDATIAWVQHVCWKFVDTFMARNRNSIQRTGLRIPDTNMPCEALLKLVMAVLDDRSPEDVAMIVEHMLKKVIEDFGMQNSGQEFEGLPVNSGGYHDGNMQPHDHKSVVQQYSSNLEAQNKELKELKHALEATKLQFQNSRCGWEKEMEDLNIKLHGLTQAAAEYHKLAAENRELYNQVQDLKGNIRVYCRVRPFLPGQNATQSTVEFIGEKGSIVIANPSKLGKEQRKAFTFNKVFGPSSAQEQVFLDTQPLIRSILDGFNVCIFAYGQTGSGKTYTMTGPNNPCPDDWGVNFRALHDLFDICKARKDFLKYEVGVQMIEIYNEQVRDLLSTDGSNKKLEIRNNSQQNGLNIPDAKLMPVRCTEDVLELMSLGHKNRAVGATALNERSSRSHSVLTVHVKGFDLTTGSVLRGCLHLVDLAGSERVDKSEATGDRLKEAQHINKSLSALGDVIAALAQKSPHIPYRNSKLTQVLQDSLGGQAKTLMFVHVSPDCDSYGETISTLKFAERVATVELGAAHSNKESGEVKELKDQVSFLKDALARKNMEVEFLEKELRARGLEYVPDRVRAKADSLSGQLSIVTGYGNHRLSVGGRENIGGMENCYLDVEFQTPPMHFLTNSPAADAPQALVEMEEESLKRRVYEGTFLDSRSGTPLDVSPLALSGTVGSSTGGSKKNKIRHGSFEELDSFMPGSLLERTKSFSMQGYGCDLDGGGQMDERHNARHVGSKASPSTDLRASPVAAWQSNGGLMKMAAESVDSYLSEEDEIASEYSDADSWLITGPDDDISVAGFGKRMQEGGRRVLSQQPPGHLAKRPTASQVQTRAHSPKKHASGLRAECRSKGGKASPEPKLVASKKPN